MPEKLQTVIPSGSLFTMTTGVYSDYTVHGVFKALKDINIEELKSKWAYDHPEELNSYNFKEFKFFGSLFKDKYFECVDSVELHLGDYSRIEEVGIRSFKNNEIKLGKENE
jgi:hypothetical protein